MFKVTLATITCCILMQSIYAQSAMDVLMNMSVGQHIGAMIEFDESTDPNSNLGRPNQYISKASWADIRIDPHDFSDENADEINNLDPVEYKGGTIEGFKNTTDLNRRYNYIKNIFLDEPTLNQYMYKKGLFLMRIDKELTPTDAKRYEKEFYRVVK